MKCEIKFTIHIDRPSSVKHGVRMYVYIYIRERGRERERERETDLRDVLDHIDDNTVNHLAFR